MRILDVLNKRRLYFDGAMGTMIQKNGFSGSGEALNIEEPELVTSIHSAYVKAGCDILKTNTFGANPLKLSHDLSVREVVFKAMENAKAAAGENTFIAIDLGPTGKLLEPLGSLGFEEAVESFAKVAALGEEFGADLALIETMSDTYELKAAVMGAKQTSLPIFATVTMDKDGHLLTGADILSIISLLEGLGVSALGINCGLSCEQAGRLLPEFIKYSSLPVILNPNAGLPKIVGSSVTYDMTPERFSESMAEFPMAGVLGGCCGTTPEHIKRLVEKTKDSIFVPAQGKGTCLVSSYRKAVLIGETRVRIAECVTEKINEDILNFRYDSLVDIALDKMMEGADVLALSVKGNAKMDEVVKAVQSCVTAPLMIKTDQISSLFDGARAYNGNPLLTLFELEEDLAVCSLDVIKRCGGVLLMDKPSPYVVQLAVEKGIPEKNVVLFDPQRFNFI